MGATRGPAYFYTNTHEHFTQGPNSLSSHGEYASVLNDFPHQKLTTKKEIQLTLQIIEHLHRQLEAASVEKRENTIHFLFIDTKSKICCTRFVAKFNKKDVC